MREFVVYLAGIFVKLYYAIAIVRRQICLAVDDAETRLVMSVTTLIPYLNKTVFDRIKVEIFV